MKFILSLLLVGVISATAFSQFPNPDTKTTPPVRVYMIQDPDGDVWYHAKALGLSGWGKQTEGKVWTIKKNANSTLGSMYGSRAARCVIKTFVLLPVEDTQ